MCLNDETTRRSKQNLKIKSLVKILQEEYSRATVKDQVMINSYIILITTVSFKLFYRSNKGTFSRHFMELV